MLAYSAETQVCHRSYIIAATLQYVYFSTIKYMIGPISIYHWGGMLKLLFINDYIFLSTYLLYCCNRIGGVMVSVLALSAVYSVVSTPGRVKPKTIKLVFVVSPLNTQH